MSLELKRSFIPRNVVDKVTRQSVELYEQSTGRKAEGKVHDNIRKNVIEGADKINKDGGMK